MNNNVFKGFVKAIVILGIIYLVFYYVSYSIWIKKGFDDVDITYNEEDKRKDETKPSETDYKKVYDKIKYELLQINFGEEFKDIYYENKGFTSEYYLYIGIVNIIKDNFVTNCNYETKLSSVEVDLKINEIFDNPKYEKKSFKTKNGYLEVTYDSISDYFLIKTNDKCSGFDYANGGIKTEYYNASESGNHLYIYEKAYYVDHSQDSNGILTFNYHSGPRKEFPIIANNPDNLDLDKVATYKYTFTRDGNIYYLQSIQQENT